MKLVGDGEEAVADVQAETSQEAVTQAGPGDPDLDHAKTAVLNSLTVAVTDSPVCVRVERMKRKIF